MSLRDLAALALGYLVLPLVLVGVLAAWFLGWEGPAW